MKIVLTLLFGLLSYQNAAAETGVEAKRILLGSSAPLSGPSAPRSKALHAGSDLFFKQLNEKGGIHGRIIERISYDDAYEPHKTVENVKKLIATDKVFALFEVFGTPTNKAILPIVQKEKVPLILPTIGARFMRQPALPGVFLLRPSENDEADRMIQYLAKNKRIKDISLFYQDDALGASGKEALRSALDTAKLKRKSEASFQRNTLDVEKGIDVLAATKPEAVVIWGPAIAAAQIIKKSIEKGFKPVFLAPSIVDTPEFLAEVTGLDAEIYIAQPLYFWAEGNSAIYQQYVRDAEKEKQKPNIGGFEGYVNAAILASVLEKAGKDLTREKLVNTFESQGSLEIGGVKLSYSPTDHEGLSEVAIMKAQKGKFVTAK